MHVRMSEDMLVLELSGELDILTTVPVLDALTTALSEHDAQTVVFDLRAVTFMDSSAIKCLIYAQNRMRVRSGRVVVSNARPHVARVIRILGLDKEIAVFDVDQEPALVDPATDSIAS